MLYCFRGTTYDVYTFLICIIQKCKCLWNEKRYSKTDNAILFSPRKAFQIRSNYVLLQRHLKGDLTKINDSFAPSRASKTEKINDLPKLVCKLIRVSFFKTATRFLSPPSALHRVKLSPNWYPPRTEAKILRILSLRLPLTIGHFWCNKIQLDSDIK